MASECKACGKPLIWAVTERGARIPLDAQTQVYRVVEKAVGAPDAIKATDCYVSHFLTCPKASQFSGTKKAE